MSESPFTPASGPVTFLFTDIEGSTQLWEQYPADMKAALARHDALLRLAVESHRGHIVKTTGDGLMAVFTQPKDGMAAVHAAQRALRDQAWEGHCRLRVRMALHSGSAEQREGDYFGTSVNRAARLMAIAHGGQILISDVTASLLRDELPPELSLRDLGEHRLRDLVRPEHVYQLIAPDLPSDFPPLHSLESFPNNLPVQLTSFIGREREMGEVRRLLGETHLVTLTGPGGTGKTRLSLQIAAEMLEQFANGAWFVELAPLADPTLIPQTVATALDVREQAGRPILSQVIDFLRPKKLLLILDNCEHLVEACARLAETLLGACPNLRLLASSREALGVAGETAYPVPPLQTPGLHDFVTPERLLEYESVRLFVERARSAQPRFMLSAANAQAVAQISRRLDGIPLAIELAAARIRLFTPEQIAARLDDRFRLLTGGNRTSLPRQQTLRALIEWSYDLLSESECVLLRRLSVFAGGWTFEGAEFVCAQIDAQRPEPLDVLEALTQLVNKSLVVVDDQGSEKRYRFLETIRQFAHDKLLESGESDPARARHFDFYLALAQRAEPELHHADQAQWLVRLDIEEDNLRAALDWAVANGHAAQALDLAGTLWWFWYIRDHFGEARERMSAALGLAPQTEASLSRVRVMIGLGFFYYAAWNLTEARIVLQEALTLSRQLGSERDYAEALQFLAATEVAEAARSTERDFTQIKTLMEESLARWQALGDATGISWSLNGLAGIAQGQGNYTDARSLLEKSVALRRAIGDPVLLAYSLRRLGDVALQLTDYAAANSAYREGLTLLMAAAGKAQMAANVASLAGLALAQGKAAKAVRLLGAVQTILQALAWQLPPLDYELNQQNIERARTQLSTEVFAAAWGEGEKMGLEAAIAYALSDVE